MQTRRQRRCCCRIVRSPGPMRGSWPQTQPGSFIIRLRNNGDSNSNSTILNRCVVIITNKYFFSDARITHVLSLLCYTSDNSISSQSKTNPSYTITSQNSLSDSQHPSTDQYRASIQIPSPFNNTFYSSLIDGFNRNRL